MPATVLFAKKIIVPSNAANVLQSVNMAAAFAQAGADTFFYPGMRRSAFQTIPRDSASALATILAEIGIQPEHARNWRPLPAGNKGVYGLLFRLHIAAAYVSATTRLAYARDVMEGYFLSRLKSICKREHKFLFEMHEILHLLHQEQKQYNWQETFRKEQSVVRAIDGLIVTNGVLAGAARNIFGYAGPILVECNGYNPALFYPLPLFSDTYPWPGSQDPVELAYIGSLTPGKGVEELLDALAILPSRFKLRIIGSGKQDMTDKVQKKAASIPQGAERIRLLGHMPQVKLREACMGVHISVLPQQQEGYFSPIKLNESLALGLPLAATPLPIFTAQKALMHMAPDLSPQGLATAIQELAASPDHASRLRAAGIAAAAGYTWQARARRILDFAAGVCAS